MSTMLVAIRFFGISAAAAFSPATPTLSSWPSVKFALSSRFHAAALKAEGLALSCCDEFHGLVRKSFPKPLKPF